MSLLDQWKLYSQITEPQDRPAAVDDSRPATVDDILRLGDSIRAGQREMATMIVEGLRPRLGRSADLAPGDPGNDGDVEEYRPRGSTLERRRPKRRNHWENMLSVRSCSCLLSTRLTFCQQRIRDHLRKLIKPDNWMKNTVPELEANAFNPGNGPCCDATNFRVHLEGTPSNPWNKSAVAVFVRSFLAAHPDYPADEEPVQEMVRMKTRAALESIIREFRESNIPRTEEEANRKRLEKNRRERKRKVNFLVRFFAHRW